LVPKRRAVASRRHGVTFAHCQIINSSQLHVVMSSYLCIVTPLCRYVVSPSSRRVVTFSAVESGTFNQRSKCYTIIIFCHNVQKARVVYSKTFKSVP
jgi:hypothetical protein